MASVFTHAIVPLAMGLGLGRATVSRRLLVFGMLASVLPDADVVGFRLGIAYAHELGHRGFSHSVAFAVAVGLLAGLAAPWLQSRRWTAFVFAMFSTVSHPLLDMCTTGGLGIALVWPWSDQRFFFPAAARVIEVAPIGFKTLFSQRSLVILRSELLWVWAPCLGTSLLLRIHTWWRQRASRSRR